MRQLFYRVFSTKIMAILLLVYAFSMAIATFIEEIYSTNTAKACIYESIWFEIIMLLLIICFISNINKYNLFSKKKWPLLIFHFAFILMFIGGAISRYIGYEGMIFLRKGDIKQQIISDKTYIKLQISNKKETISYHDPYLFSNFHYDYHGKFFFNNKIFQVKVINYVPHAKKVFFENLNGKKTIKIVTIQNGKKVEVFLQSGEIKNFKNFLISFNKIVKGSIQIFEYQNKLHIISPFNGNYFIMSTKKMGLLFQKTLSNVQFRSLYNIKEIQFVIPNNIQRGIVQYISVKKDKKNFPDAITAKIFTNTESKLVTFLGDKGITSISKEIFLDRKKINIGYGSIFLNIPFAIRLNKFKLEKYPGSESPSSFLSEVTIINRNEEKNYNIFMNNVLNYKGYRFFQSGYDPDENGTRLSVSHDNYGMLISYISYCFLGVGMFFTLFWNGTRFKQLQYNLKKLTKISTFLLFLISTLITAYPISNKIKKLKINQFCNTVKIPKYHSEKFERLLLQDSYGRIKPVQTMALDLLRKVYKKDKISNLSATQWLISMSQDGWMSFSQNSSIGWLKVPFIKININNKEKLFKKIQINKDGYTALIDLYTANILTGKINFIFENEYENAFIKNPAHRNEYEKSIINLNERINITSGIFQGQYLKIFPIPNDKKNIWKGWMTSRLKIDTLNFSMINHYFSALYHGQRTKDWTLADKILEKIQEYQKYYGYKIIPTESRIKAEILYNNLNIFYYVMILYLIISILLFILFFIKIFIPFKKINILYKFFIYILFLIFLYHIFGLGLRWYISNHAPWSNGYESAIFISVCIILSGFIFYKYKNIFVPTITSLLASIILIIAHSNLMDPEITNLVPVLKSYWLMIHVAIITSSYAFLSMGAFLGLIVLILFLFIKKSRQKQIKILITELTIINEMTLTIGLFLLTIGTFLGGIWANESWGRYWSWDPKETWAFISIIIYTFVLHMRLVTMFRGFFIFNLMSLLAISSIIMTYFGVNYYLSGLHSYAKGSPIPIPKWIYYSIIFVLSLSILSYCKIRKLSLKNEFL